MDTEIQEYIKKIRDESNKDIERHIGALFEEFDSRMTAVKEQHDGHFESIQKTLDTHTEMIGNLMVDMSQVKSDISEIKDELKNKADAKDFFTLEKRVSALEAS